MKKLIGILFLIILAPIVFVGCAKAEEPIDCWQFYEEYEYSVKHTIDDASYDGVMTMKLERISKVDISLGSYTATDFTGTKISYNITINMDEPQKIESVVYIKNNRTPVISYNKFDTTERKAEVYAKYNAKNVEYTIDGIPNTLSYKGDYIDNSSLYVIIRAFDLDYSGFSSSFNMPIFYESSVQSMTVSTSSKTKVNVEYLGNEIDCHDVNIRINSNLSGLSVKAYYAVDPIDFENGNGTVKLYKVPVAIIENKTEYRLKNVINAYSTPLNN